MNSIPKQSFVLEPPRNILVFEAHSDDMVIGMGATVKKLTSKGVRIILVTVTMGETAHALGGEGSIVETRKQEGMDADHILGVKDHVFLKHGCQSVQNDRETYHEFVRIIREYKPDWIFTHGSHEWHRDHRTISQLTEETWWKASEINVLPELGDPFKAKALLFFEVLPMFASNPDVCFDVTSTWDAKTRAIGCFTSQFATMGDFEGLVEGKGRYRGFLIGTRYAEAFIYSRFMPRTRF